MKLIYNIQSGNVIGLYSEPFYGPTSRDPIEIQPTEDQVLLTIPSSVLVPQAIVRVIPPSDPESSDYQFIVDQALIDSQWISIKTLRAQKLRESDWICSVTDYVVPNKDAWISYRQALRDLTQQSNPFQIVWPMEPTSAVPSASRPESSVLLESPPSN